MGTTPRELPPQLQGFGADTKRLAAATAAYSDKLNGALSDDVALELDDQPTQPHHVVPDSSPTQRAVLEPVSEDAHPVEHRRMPTRPELMSEAHAAVATDPRTSAPEPTTPEPASTTKLPLGANRSPSPIPVRMGLFSADRITNSLVGGAIGLLLTIVPAHKLALAHAKTLLVQPLLELNDSIDHPLAVDAGLLRKPQAIAAEIAVSREAVRDRYLLIWLLGGLPLGLALGLVPRWWA